MNKKGISDLYMLLIQLIAISLIFALLFYKSSDVDVDAIHIQTITKDIGLSNSVMSFLPINIKYTYLSEDDGNWLSWVPFYIVPFSDTIKVYKEYGDLEKGLLFKKYSTFYNKKKSFLLNNIDFLRVEKDSFSIISSDKVYFTKNTSEDLVGLQTCDKIKKNYYFKKLYNCSNVDETGLLNFCDEYGNKVPLKEVNFEVEYAGFDKKYFLNDIQYYKGKGLVKNGYSEVSELEKLLDKLKKYSFVKGEMGSDIKPDDLKPVYLSATSEGNYFIVEIPFNSFKEDFAFGCNLLNLARKSKIYEGSAVVPTYGNKIVVKLGSVEKINQSYSILEEFLQNE